MKSLNDFAGGGVGSPIDLASGPLPKNKADAPPASFKHSKSFRRKRSAYERGRSARFIAQGLTWRGKPRTNRNWRAFFGCPHIPTARQRSLDRRIRQAERGLTAADKPKRPLKYPQLAGLPHREWSRRYYQLKVAGFRALGLTDRGTLRKLGRKFSPLQQRWLAEREQFLKAA